MSRGFSVAILSCVLTLLVAPPRPASGKTFYVEVTFEHDGTCVTHIDVDPKDVGIGPWPHRLRLGNTKVDWTLQGADPTGSSWSVQRITASSSAYEICQQGAIPFGSDGVASCKVKNKGLEKNFMAYEIRAAKQGCSATFDPQIIFKSGSEGFVTFLGALVLWLFAAVVGVFGVRKFLARRPD